MFCSIVIPLYNKADFIEAALQSVLNQQYQNFEVIVVDDGSQDDGPARVSAMKDKRIHLIRQANGGVSCARNRGIAHASGELVCFLDADDWYLPAYLETIVSMAKTYPGIAYFGTGYKRVSTFNTAGMTWDIEDLGVPQRIDDFFYRWRFGAFLFTGSVAVRRVDLNLLQPCFPIGESMGEDQDLWFRLAEKYPLAYCPSALVGYRVEVEGSLCATNEMRALLPAYLRLEQRALHRQMRDELRSSALRLVSEAKVTVARTTLMSGRRFDALFQLLGAWRGMCSKRWWVSVAMCALCTPGIVRRWEYWRHLRTRTW